MKRKPFYRAVVLLMSLLFGAVPVANAASPHGVLLDTPAIFEENNWLGNPSGQRIVRSGAAEIDYSNVGQGYVMVRYTQPESRKIKVQVKGPATTYSYDLRPGGQWTTLPLTDGNGSYTVAVYVNLSGTQYTTAGSAQFSLRLENEFAPFLYSNQYVNYADAPSAQALADQLTAGMTNELDMVGAIYDYVIANLVYDKQKAQSVQSGYLPVLDQVLAERKGICFDYASLMAGMLRHKNVPCKMVVGYAGTAYHAWISVWTKDLGWIDGAIYFDGSVWHRMDPTFASSAHSSQQIMQYIGNGQNYTEKFIY